MHHLMQMIHDTFQHSKTPEEHRQHESESIDLFNLLSRWAINSLAMLGFLLIGIVAFLYIEGRLSANSLDAEFVKEFSEFTEKTLKSNVATALTIKFPLKSNVTVEQAVESIKDYAEKMQLQLSDNRSLKIKTLENSQETFFVFELQDLELTAQLLDHNPDFSAFLPFRIILYTSKNQAWLTTADFKLLIYGSRNLEEEIKVRALTTRDELLKMMIAGANGVKESKVESQKSGAE